MASTIERADVIVTSPGRNFVTLRITTSDGVEGLGDATLNGRELAVASYLRDHVCPLLLARDPDRIEDTWQYLYRGGYWRRGPVTMAAIAAVDQALWDIKAKVAGQPLYQLLGGASRDGLLAYGHASGTDLPALFDSIDEHLAAGYRAIRVQSGVPGRGAIYGVARSSEGERYDYEPARRQDLPVEETWDTSAYLRHIPTVFDAVRAKFGPELPLLHDAHHRLTPIQAARLGKSLEPFDLFWLEDCTPAENQAGLRLVREHTTTPLAIGEVFNTDLGLPAADQRAAHRLRALLGHPRRRHLADEAALGLCGDVPDQVGHAWPDRYLTGRHGCRASPGSGHPQLRDPGVHAAQPRDVGRLPDVVHLRRRSASSGDQPGLGVSLDDDAAAAYPYVPAYLPTARLADGTVHDW